MLRFCCGVGLLCLLYSGHAAWAQNPAPTAGESQAGDPAEVLCTVDGQPIYRGEMNLLLAEQLAGEPLDTASEALKQAIASTLVRRHLAQRTLSQIGGEALQSKVQDGIRSAAQQAERRGDSLQQIAARAGSDVRSLSRDLTWRISWSTYVRSRLTPQNLQRFFDANKARYDGTTLRVSHIFLARAEDSSAAPSLAILQDVAQRIAAADDPQQAFADAAVEHSQAPSAADGGQLGWVDAQGDLPPQVSDAILQAASGELVGPLESPLGFHLLWIHERREGQLSMDQMSDQAPLRRDAADALFNALVRQHGDPNVQWLVESLRPSAGAPH